METPRSALSSSCNISGGTHVALLSIGHFVPQFPTHFRGLKPSVNSKDLVWPVTGGKSPALKNKYVNQHLSYY